MDDHLTQELGSTLCQYLGSLAQHCRACGSRESSHGCACRACDRTCNSAGEKRAACSIEYLAEGLALGYARHDRCRRTREGCSECGVCRRCKYWRRRAAGHDRQDEQSRYQYRARNYLYYRLVMLFDKLDGCVPGLLDTLPDSLEGIGNSVSDLLEEVAYLLPNALFLRGVIFRPGVLLIEYRLSGIQHVVNIPVGIDGVAHEGREPLADALDLLLHLSLGGICSVVKAFLGLVHGAGAFGVADYLLHIPAGQLEYTDDILVGSGKALEGLCQTVCCLYPQLCVYIFSCFGQRPAHSVLIGGEGYPACRY